MGAAFMHDQDALPVESDSRAAGESWDEASFPEMKPAPVSPFSHPRQPPLGIVHLMVWTALSATYLGFNQLLSPEAPGEGADWYELFRGAEAVLYAPMCGAGLFGLVLMAWRQLTRGVRFPSQPGHWLMVFYGCGVSIWMVGAALNTWLIPDLEWHDSPGAEGVLVLYLAQNLVSGILAGVATSRLKDKWYWRADLLMLSVVQFVVAALSLFLIVPSLDRFLLGVSPGVALSLTVHLGGLTIGAVLLVIAACELARRVHRDWLHWVGVALGLGFPCLSLADQIARSILQALVSGSP